MATVTTGISGDATLLNLKEISPADVRKEVNSILVPGEEIIQCFRTIRDQVIFTDKRVISVNVQGLGKKVSFISYPYSKVQYFAVETAGILDIDSELTLAFTDGNKLQFDFRSRVDIKRICSTIARYAL